jgi:hypothetical protein
MVLLEMPRSVRGNGPTMATIIEVGLILSKSRYDGPLSLAEIGRRMRAKRVRHMTIRACVEFLSNLGFVTEGSKGVFWTHAPDTRVWEAVRRSKRLA